MKFAVAVLSLSENEGKLVLLLIISLNLSSEGLYLSQSVLNSQYLTCDWQTFSLCYLKIFAWNAGLLIYRVLSQGRCIYRKLWVYSTLSRSWWNGTIPLSPFGVVFQFWQLCTATCLQHIKIFSFCLLISLYFSCFCFFNVDIHFLKILNSFLFPLETTKQILSINLL